ncbi:MAG TPA: putative toxin-antitoxin system toxin component, PIN family [Bacteroidales bacterium]|nr:putative toxin-antitoxin system toxin component, PIN family [Bacteroidales bacterium]
MNFVFDANVLVSVALFRNSVPALAYKKAQQGGKILISETTLNELKSTLEKPKLRKYITVKDKGVFLSKIMKIALFIDIIHSVNACRDPKDNMYLELALSGKADVIVTGDADLLVLHPFRSIPIVTPKNFLDNFEV